MSNPRMTAAPGTPAGTRAATPVLPQFTRQKSPLERLLKHGAFLIMCVVLGVVYGFFYAVFPPFMLVYMAMPILILLLVTIWALPDQGTGPITLLERLFYLSLLVPAIWPVYLAVQLPGLPWISLVRVVGFPTFLILLICISVSSRFRRQMGDVLRASGIIWKLLVALIAVEMATVLWSAAPFASLNKVANGLILSQAIFFIAAWVLAREGRLLLLERLLIATAAILCAIGLLELSNQNILWAKSIPGWLAVGDSSVLRILEQDIRDGGYRVTTVFSVSLSLAEYLALVTPFVIRRLLACRSIFPAIAWLAFDLVLLAVIITTRSRLGMVGWIGAHAIYGAIWSFRRWRLTRGDIIGPAMSLLYPAAVGVFVVAMFTVDAVKFRTIGGGSSGLSDDARRQQYELFWPKLFRNPFGYGAGRSGDVLGFTTQSGLVTVDSYPITIALDYGVLGFSLFFGLLAVVAWKMWRLSLYTRPGEEEEMAMPLAAATTVFLIIRFVFSQEDNFTLGYALLGASVAVLYRAARRSAAAAPAEAEPQRRGHPLPGPRTLIGARA